jgi:hypothetical protein
MSLLKCFKNFTNKTISINWLSETKNNVGEVIESYNVVKYTWLNAFIFDLSPNEILLNEKLKWINCTHKLLLDLSIGVGIGDKITDNNWIVYYVKLNKIINWFGKDDHNIFFIESKNGL